MRHAAGKCYACRSAGKGGWWEVREYAPPGCEPEYRVLGGYMTEEAARLWAETLNKRGKNF